MYLVIHLVQPHNTTIPLLYIGAIKIRACNRLLCKHTQIHNRSISRLGKCYNSSSVFVSWVPEERVFFGRLQVTYNQSLETVAALKRHYTCNFGYKMKTRKRSRAARSLESLSSSSQRSSNCKRKRMDEQGCSRSASLATASSTARTQARVATDPKNDLEDNLARVLAHLHTQHALDAKKIMLFSALCGQNPVFTKVFLNLTKHADMINYINKLGLGGDNTN